MEALEVGVDIHIRRVTQNLGLLGDPPEGLNKVVDFEQFRAPLEAALGYADGWSPTV